MKFAILFIAESHNFMKWCAHSMVSLTFASFVLGHDLRFHDAWNCIFSVAVKDDCDSYNLKKVRLKRSLTLSSNLQSRSCSFRNVSEIVLKNMTTAPMREKVMRTSYYQCR